MQNSKVVIFATFFTLIIFSYSSVYSYSEGTHKAINEHIGSNDVIQFSLGNYLIENLGFDGGSDEILNAYGKTYEVWKWLGEGGVKEDRPGNMLAQYMGYVTNSARNNNHFHNPLKPWYFAGLSEWPFTGQSLVLWAQNPMQIRGGYWSWQDARNYYYLALTSRYKWDRDRHFADTFRAVGQQMHLIHDAAVPEHARNDLHIFPAYEARVEKFMTKRKYRTFWISNLRNATTFDESILSLPSNSLAPIPIARIVDTDKYNGKNPDVTNSTAIGLAEYTNANFLSWDTMYTSENPNNIRHYFPYPKRENAEWSDKTDKTFKKRTYLRKVGNGVTVNHLATVSAIYDTRMKYFPQYGDYLPIGLDKNCFKEYASLLIPRAVGYSAGLLKYFFRGDMTIVPVKNNPAQYAIKNLSDEPMNGTFEIYYDNKYYSVRKKLGSSNLIIPAQGTSSPITITPPSSFNEQIEKYIVVFKGTLGNEQDAVVGKVMNPPNHAFIIQEQVEVTSVQPERTYPIISNWYSHIGNGCSGQDFYDPSDGYSGCYRLPLDEKEYYEGGFREEVRLSGRFVIYGDVTSIQAAGGNFEFYVDGQLVPGGVWTPTAGSPVPTTWNIVGPGADAIIVTFSDGTSIKQDLFSYRRYGTQRGKEAEHPYTSKWTTRTNATFRKWTSRVMELYGGSLFINSKQATTDNMYGLWLYNDNLYGTENTAIPACAFGQYKNCLSMSGSRVSYFKEEEVSWTRNFGPANQVSTTMKSIDYFDTVQLMNILPSSEFTLDRIYSQAELDYLKKLGIEPEYYTITFR